jgi:CRISPR-associated protein Csx17
MILHRLDGCAPTPLAHYLKALGVLRLVAEQLDADARGWWEGERFYLATCRDQDELLSFFLNDYAPSPLVSPWNKGSGFFYPDDVGLTPIETSAAPRLGLLRDACRAVRVLLDAMTAADRAVRSIKAETKNPALSAAQRRALKQSASYRRRLAEAEHAFKRRKAELIPDLHLTWRGLHRNWLEVAMVIDAQGNPRFPALLGTGGNDGRFEFTNNYYQRLGDLFDLSDPVGKPNPLARAGLREALFAELARTSASGIPAGQFAPGNAGGANAGNGPDAVGSLNPWDFVLLLEGALLFTAASTRRIAVQASARAVAPFAIGAQAAGYASAAGADESARGEQWMPLWSQPTTRAELRRLLAEGRAQLGPRQVREPLELARAVARLGTARGISAFQRYGYMQRNGQSNLAVPLGRFAVRNHTAAGIACIDDLDGWLQRLRRNAREPGAPARLRMAARQLGDALFAVVQHPDVPARWQTVLLRMADIEMLQMLGGGRHAGPLPTLRPEWVNAADDGSAEIRLALALALQVADAHGGADVDGVRRHWITSAKAHDQAARSDRVIHGRSGEDDAIALVARRLIEAAARGERRLPLEPRFGVSASRHDLARLLAGAVDLDRCLALSRALMALDARACARSTPQLRSAPEYGWPDDAWLAIRIALLPGPLLDGRHVACDPAILRYLDSGDVSAAFALANRRLRAAGIGCAVRVAAAAPDVARLYAAALAFPISAPTTARFVQRLAPAPSRPYPVRRTFQ